MLKEYEKIETVFEMNKKAKKINENKYRNETVELRDRCGKRVIVKIKVGDFTE